MGKRMTIALGREMHTSYKDGYETIYEFKNKDDEDTIDNDTLYAVYEDYSELEYCGGITGDSIGEKHKVLTFEKVPDTVLNMIEEKKLLTSKINDYLVSVKRQYLLNL